MPLHVQGDAGHPENRVVDKKRIIRTNGGLRRRRRVPRSPRDPILYFTL
jgi:hypothetical protein